MELVLRVQVLKGRNLAAKDKSGYSDPFLVLTLGDAKEATSVVSKTLNPEWNQTFELPVMSPDAAILEAVCWDKDRFKKDYMGEFDVAVEDIFASGDIDPEAQWFKLESRRSGRKKKKDENVSGEILLKFTLYDPINSAATPQQLLQKFTGLVAEPVGLDDDDEEAILDTVDSRDLGDLDEEDDEKQALDSEEFVDGAKGRNDTTEDKQRRRQRLKLAKLERKRKLRAYELGNTSDVVGVLYLEINKITDLPPESNMTGTTFDMDPFVITSLGKKTYRTRVINHNLNPVYDEKLVFSVQKHEKNFKLFFTVVDRDKFSGNDFVGTASFSLDKALALAPEADAETGLYKLRDPDSVGEAERERRRRFRMPISRSTSQNNTGRISRTSSGNNLAKLAKTNSFTNAEAATGATLSQGVSELLLADQAKASNAGPGSGAQDEKMPAQTMESTELSSYELPIDLKNKRWADKHSPVLYIKAKYLPYQALRQQFWRVLLRQYDADESGKIDKVEFITMLDTLGSTLHNSTIDGFFNRWRDTNQGEDVLTMDQAVICLEEQLLKPQYRSGTASPLLTSGDRSLRPNIDGFSSVPNSSPEMSPRTGTPLLIGSDRVGQMPTTPDIPMFEVNDLGESAEFGSPIFITTGEEGEVDPETDLRDEFETKEEHVVQIRECPICHQPRISRGRKATDADIITHIATCASSDWRAVNNLVMGGFVTSSQAQRKWYSKVIAKVSYGGYKLGANSANILVQDRLTGMINEERMSVYVRLGIRLLYKGLKSREMEKKRVRKLLRSLSLKQGRKYDDPASAAQIAGFINFHQLDMSEVLLPIEEFKNFNEFFYRKLKPDARPCSAPNDSHIIVSPADCRSVVFNRIEEAQNIWVKGREFTVERLFGDAYPEDAKRYRGGALGIMRLAPQDYHRFHIPVDGVMGEPKLIEGEYYTVNPMAIRSALDVYGENVRVCVPIDSVSHGRVMIVCVGAMMVGSTVITRQAGEHVKRAEELGYFKFGGSTLLLLFEPGTLDFDEDLVANSTSALETLVRVGMSLGRSPHHSAHVPDMQKANPTEEEKKDAKRRIEGSLSESTGAGAY